MTRYPTLDAARAAAEETDQVIVRVLCTDGQAAYIRATLPADSLRKALASRPHPEISRVIEDYDVLAPEQRAALVSSIPCQCERCGQECTRETDYHQTERGQYGTVTAYYCAGCCQVLHAVGGGERTAMDERRSERQDDTPSHKEDA